MLTSSMLSTLRLRRYVLYLVGAAGVRPFFTQLDEPGTMLAWADADWSGNEMTCRATSAGAVQLESHEIEAWSMIQQMVLLSSAESEFYAVDAPNVDRRETLGRRRKKDRRNVAERAVQAVEEVPDTIDGLNKEVKCTRPAFGNPRSRGREPPDKISPGLTTLENAKETPSDLDTRVLEREAMPSRVSKLRVFVVTGQFATSWSTRAQWRLARTASASDEVIVDGHWSKRVNGTTTGVMEATDSISTFAVNTEAGGAVARAMLVWRVAMSSCSVWS